MKNKPSPDRQFVKFTALLCISGLILSTFSGVLWDNFSSIRGQKTSSVASMPKDLAEVAPISFRALSGATSDFEADPMFWWIWNNTAAFELSNTSNESRIVSLNLSLGQNPCGFRAVGNLSFRNAVQELVPGKSLSLDITMEGKSSLIFPLSVTSFGCAIESDPRVFVASLTSSISSSTLSEYQFQN